MKKILFLFVFIAAPILAQSIAVSSKVELIGDGASYFPKFSPDGSTVFFTHAGYKGLEYVDVKTKTIEKLTDEAGAGYEFCFSQDGSQVYYRTDVYKGLKKYSSLISQNIATKQLNVLESEKRNLSSAQTLSSGEIFYRVNNSMKSVDAPKSLKKQSLQNNAAVYSDNEGIAVVTNGYKKVIEPAGKGSYIWTSLSPDGSKILFALGTKGTFICDLSGNILVDLGRAHAPQWSPDGKWVLYMDDYDDGYDYTKSDIYAITADGLFKTALTSGENEIAMYPQWSNDGMQVVYHTNSGNIMLLNLTIAE